MTGHEMRISVHGPDQRHHRAHCACGWEGLLRGTRARARREFMEHRETAGVIPPDEQEERSA